MATEFRLAGAWLRGWELREAALEAGVTEYEWKSRRPLLTSRPGVLARGTGLMDDVNRRVDALAAGSKWPAWYRFRAEGDGGEPNTGAPVAPHWIPE